MYDLYEDYDYETDTYTTTIKDGGWYYFASLDDSYGGYHVAEKTDLDNDGENELVLEYRDWPEYCGRFIDASDGVVHELAAGEGTGEQRCLPGDCIRKVREGCASSVNADFGRAYQSHPYMKHFYGRQLNMK